MTFFNIIAICFFTSLWAGPIPSRSILHYDPETVELSGKIEQQAFPGSPNYESIPEGDQVEKGWYLRLDRPIDVVETKNDAPSPSSETERNVKIMHLAWGENPGLRSKIKDVTKSKCEVHLKGHLFHRWSGHHHSRVLMWVDTLEIKK